MESDILLKITDCLSPIKTDLLSKEGLMDIINKLQTLLVQEPSSSYADSFQIVNDLMDNQQYWEYVSENLKCLREKALEYLGQKDIVYKQLDYYYLEARRYVQLQQLFSRQSNEIYKVQETLENTKQELDKAKEETAHTRKRLQKTKSKIDSSYASFITILGIFSGITMTFSGGLSLFGNTLAAASNGTSIYSCHQMNLI